MKPRILAVEDNAIERQVLTTYLPMMGCDLDVATDAPMAFKLLLGDAQYDLILMDIQLPGMSGLDAIQRIRTMLGATARLPIIAVTAYAMSGDRKRFLDCGCSDYLAKPYERRDLYEVLNRHLKGLIEPRRGPAKPGLKSSLALACSTFN